MTRAGTTPRCHLCDLWVTMCICALAPRLDLATRVVIFMHASEIPRTTNTARPALLALANSEIRVRGVREEPVDALDLIADPATEPLLLYPTEDAEDLTPALADSLRQAGRRATLVVPDGSWRQGAKVQARTPGIVAMRRVRLPEGGPGEYFLRTAPHPGWLSTYEAIARALGVIEGDEVRETLMDYFHLKIDRMRWARSDILEADVRGGVPAAAVDSYRIAGMRGSPRHSP